MFVAFFLMLILTETPMNLSLIGSGVATLIIGTYLGLVLMGKPLKTISTNIDKLTSGKRVGYFIGYGITFAVALLVGFFTRKLLISLDTETEK